MTAFWCEQAWLGPDTTVRNDGVLITVAGDYIGSVEAGVAVPPADATRLVGVTLPGIANAHSHAFHRALRGRTHGGVGTFWTWRDHMYRLAGSLDPDRYEELATATFAEMVLAGYTAVGEFHYLHHDVSGRPYGDPNEMGERVVNAAARAGIRLTLLDTCYLFGGVGQPVDGVQHRFSDGTAGEWMDRVDRLAPRVPHGSGPTGRVQLGAAIHSVRAVDPDSIGVVDEWARSHDVVLHAHVSEQLQENDDCLRAYGATPVELLARHVDLERRFTAVHAIHLSATDVGHLTASGTSCCVCPTTERDLADGIGPTAALRYPGALCIGSDSHAVIDPFEETRAIELDERLRSGGRGSHDPSSLLRAATQSGYSSLGWRGGEIAAGNLADFVTVGFDSVRLAGADRDDVAAAVVFGATASDVTDVVVGGEHIVHDGVHRSLDVATALDDSIRAVWAAVER